MSPEVSCGGEIEVFPARLIVGRRRVPETGLRPHRHHQHHGPYVPDPMERHETPDPVRFNALESRFHCVRQRADLHDQYKPA
jgi:hypothetical protein